MLRLDAPSRLYHIGRYGALHQVPTADPRGVLREHPVEDLAEPPPLLLRVANPHRSLVEPAPSVHHLEVREYCAKKPGHLDMLPEPHVTRVYEDRVEPLTESPVGENSRGRTIDAARYRYDGAPATNSTTYILQCLLYKAVHVEHETRNRRDLEPAHPL